MHNAPGNGKRLNQWRSAKRSCAVRADPPGWTTALSFQTLAGFALAAPLQVTPMFGSYKTVRLTCPDVDGFSIAVRTRVNGFVNNEETIIMPNLDREAGFAEFVVLTKSLQNGEIIGADDVRLVQRDTNPGVGHFRDVYDVVGRKVKRALTINQIIRARHLELDYAIQKDQSVIIESKIGPVTVVSAGIAVERATCDRVRVKNNSSGLLVEGVAISEKKSAFELNNMKTASLLETLEVN